MRTGTVSSPCCSINDEKVEWCYARALCRGLPVQGQHPDLQALMHLACCEHARPVLPCFGPCPAPVCKRRAAPSRAAYADMCSGAWH